VKIIALRTEYIVRERMFFFSCIREVSGSNLDRLTNCTVSHHSRRCWDSTWMYTTTPSFEILRFMSFSDFQYRATLCNATVDTPFEVN
jgi:hypothetical protein